MSKKLYHGPRACYYGLRLASGCSASYQTSHLRDEDTKYYLANGTEVMAWTVTEACVYPGCNGSGIVSVPGRHGHRDADCPQCAKVGRPADVTHVLPVGVAW